jgi:hypothetical protein
MCPDMESLLLLISHFEIKERNKEKEESAIQDKNVSIST